MTSPDMVSVGSKIEELEDGRFVLGYSVVIHRLQKVAAEGESLADFAA